MALLNGWGTVNEYSPQKSSLPDFLADALEHSPLPTCVLSERGAISWSNHAFRVVFGSPVTTAFTERLVEQLPGVEEDQHVRMTLPNAEGWEIECEVFVSALESAAGDTRIFLQFFDASDRLRLEEQLAESIARTRNMNDELKRGAKLDSLTGLLNRGEALRRVERITQRKTRTGSRIAVLFCDLDKFKDVNDAYGHAAGDHVLQVTAQRIAKAIRADDYAARIGGDEILVVLSGVHTLDEAIAVAEDLRGAAARRIDLGRGIRVVPTLSIGVTLFSEGEPVDALVERADNAMYRAKESGRNRVVAVE